METLRDPNHPTFLPLLGIFIHQAIALNNEEVVCYFSVLGPPELQIETLRHLARPFFDKFVL